MTSLRLVASKEVEIPYMGIAKDCIVLIGISLCLSIHSQTSTTSQKTDQQDEPRRTQRDDTIVHENNGSPTATVFTYGRTPLQEAIIQINEEYGWTVSYEDAPTVNAAEIVDDNAEFRRSRPGFHPELQDGYSPNGQPFQSTFNEINEHRADEEIVLEKLLLDYNASTNPGRYNLRRTPHGGYFVVGTSYTSESGLKAENTAILDCQISVTVTPTSLHDALQLVADKVNDTCKNNLRAKLDGIFAGEWPMWPDEDDLYGTYRDQTARDVILDLIDQEEYLLVYSVEYAPGLNVYYLETYPASKKTVGVDGNQISEPIRNPKFISENFPFESGAGR